QAVGLPRSGREGTRFGYHSVRRWLVCHSTRESRIQVRAVNSQVLDHLWSIGGIALMKVICINYQEIERECGGGGTSLPSLSDAISTQPQDHEEEIARYLERAPNYCAMGKVVGDALNPSEAAILFPGTNTDGLYLWPLELAYYVRKYHVRLPREFL